MVAEYDAASELGAKGALLRREGLYDSHIAHWRKQFGQRPGGAPGGGPVAGKEPGKGSDKGPSAAEVERLRRENERLAKRLAQTQAALEVMGKAHALLEMLSGSADSAGQ